MLQSESRVARSVVKETWRIAPNSITNRSDEPIAQGGFGEVYTATYFGSDVAIKQLLAKYGEEEIKEFRREIEIWYKLNHSNILPLHGACDLVEKPFMVSPFMKNGTLRSFVSDPACRRSISDKLRLMYQVASGMAYLHSNGIIHADLKSDNVFIDSGNNAVIADFGLAKTKRTSIRSQRSRTNNSICGTVIYMAPEMLDDEEPTGSSRETDVYAFGVTFFEILKDGRDTWVTKDGGPMHQMTVVRQVCKGKRPKRFDGIPDQIWSLVESCWHQDPYHRPSFVDILSQLS
ncbi:kinase-like domain-containing protein, partial [Polychytrium aggregatum]|uniref:kinase-like domain-containing protein n=1 Tax=Polychytrium aggregatum TaxID=110093 RepID=UPI0022FE351C